MEQSWLDVLLERLSATIPAIVSFFFALLMHVIIVIGVFVLLYLIIRLILNVQSDSEKFVRVLAFACGLLVVIATKVLGVSISDLLLQSITLSDPISLALLGVMVPSGSGFLSAWYFTRSLKRSTNIATRVMIFVGTLLALQFVDVYAKAVGTSGFGLNSAFMPNVVFVIAMGIYIFLRYDPEERNGG
jgi:hypothetical protein